MIKRKLPIKIYATVVIAIATMVGLFFANQAYVELHPGGMDFLAHWQGARGFISDGINPYSEQAAGSINSRVQELLPGTIDNYRFVAPLISLLFLAPFSFITEFSISLAVWMTFLEGLVILCGLIVARWTRLNVSTVTMIVVAIVLLFNYSSTTAIQQGGLVIVSFSMIIGAIHLLLRKQDEAAGMLLALSLVQPDLVYPIILIMLVWVIAKKRFIILWWFLATFVLLIGFSMVLIPSWPIDYIKSVIDYSARNPVRMEEISPTALEIRLLLFKNLALAVLVFYEWFVVKISGNQRFLWSSGLLLAVSHWIGGAISISHTIFIYPAFFIALGFLSSIRGSKNHLWVLVASVLFGVSTWLPSANLFAGSSDAWIQSWITILLPLVALILLYWSRWWIIRNEKYSDDIFYLK